MTPKTTPRAADVRRLEKELGGAPFDAARMVGLVDCAPRTGWHVVVPVESISTPLDLTFEEDPDGGAEE